MNRKQQSLKKNPRSTSNSDLASGLKETLDAKYARILEAAHRQWERDFRGSKDPSDACVTVRISGPQVNARALPALREFWA